MQNRLNLGCRVVFERFAAGKEKILEDPLLYIDIPFFHKKGEDRKKPYYAILGMDKNRKKEILDLG